MTLIQTAWGWERGGRGGQSYLKKKKDRNMLANLLILLFFHKVNSNTYVLEKLLKKKFGIKLRAGLTFMLIKVIVSNFSTVYIELLAG